LEDVADCCKIFVAGRAVKVTPDVAVMGGWADGKVL
jgi:hypothetical protein